MHPDFKLDYLKIKKPNMPVVVDLADSKENKYKQFQNFLALNLGGEQDKLEGVLNIDIGNYHNVDLICSLYTLPLKITRLIF